MTTSLLSQPGSKSDQPLASSSNPLASSSNSSTTTTTTDNNNMKNNDSSSSPISSSQTKADHESATQNSDDTPKKKQAKRRKVNLACIYCRRSHMTCDEGRPCQRCIKRDIGHLCHDETTAKNGGSSSARRTSTTPKKSQVLAKPESSAEMSPSGTAIRPPSEFPSLSTENNQNSSNNASTLNLAPFVAKAGGPHSMLAGGDAPAFFPNSILNPSSVAPPGQLSTPAGPFLGASGPYSSASPLGNLNSESGLSPFGQPSTSIFRDGVSPLRTANQFTSGQLGSAQNGIGGILSSGQLSSSTGTGDWGIGGNQGLGSAGWLGLGGGPANLEGGGGGLAGDSAGGNEFTLLSEFLESLDGSAFFNSGQTPKPLGPAIAPLSTIGGPLTTSQAGSAGGSGSRRNTVSGQVQSATKGQNDAQPDGSSGNGIGGNNSMRMSLPPPSSNHPSPELEDGPRGSKRARVSSDSNPNGVSSEWGAVGPSSTANGTSTSASNKSKAASNNGDPIPLVGKNATKTERFFLTAADQKDGTRDERLGRVIQAKYEAGLLRPYNHVNGYARLNRWMERNVSQASKRRILKPLSVFRPAFRAIAQSLTNIDLIFIEEAFERLLLDYDRVFSTQGIPACLWRRTGEIYKGNKEFAELVGVPIESLRDGRLCIYELMAEESAVNYWEKYGAVSFDPGQKAVLTSCVLRTKNKALISSKEKQSSTNAISGNAPRFQAASSGQATPSAGLKGKTEESKIKEKLPAGSSVLSKQGGQVTSNTNVAQAPGASSGNNIAGSSSAPKKDGPSSSTAGPSNGSASKSTYINCCFSFTIRRDQWNIPTMIVGNFLPTNPT
ncbi:hypothetical protein IE53DRAFT_69531 [Violaceomyces palustris]|uniref:Uncharacterized protein n=1 Tax=Violaceomyces palustris TaxID=1673888 RepID=A0ACD0NZ79_9BASI|nr:hypothetical protein IE53DRAFT_69531 [Violaceomyces palustris]